MATSIPPSLDDDLALALELADLADAIALPRFTAADLRVDTKPDRSHVTDADLAVERAIRDRLEEARPSDGLLGEEFGTSGSRSRRWIVDPIDGTANFLRGVPNWATLIALEVDGRLVLGVVSAPAFGARWWASAGGGAWAAEGGADPRRMRVSSVAALDDASVSTQSIRQWDEVGRLDQLVALERATWRDRAYGDMWAYMLLADGRLDAVAEFGVKEWDLAAIVPIVTEAGGRLTDIDGAERIDTRSSLATNGALHDAIGAIVAPTA